MLTDENIKDRIKKLIKILENSPVKQYKIGTDWCDKNMTILHLTETLTSPVNHLNFDAINTIYKLAIEQDKK